MAGLVIIRLGSLGDIVHTLPALAALRRAFPNERISWIVEPKGKEILDFVAGIDEIAVLEKNRLSASLKPVKGKDSTVFDFQGLIKSAFLARMTGAKRRIGFHKKNLKEPLASFFYTEQIAKLPEEEIHVISKNLRLLSAIGVNEERYEFPIRLPDRLREEARAKLRASGYDSKRKVVVCNVGAAWETKRWLAERWAELIRRIRRDDLFLILLWGNKPERDLAKEIAGETGTVIAPFLTIPEVMALLMETSLLVSGDTFALQAACALVTPVVALFGPTNPLRNGPFRPGDSVAFHKLDCNPCYQTKCSNLECLKLITPDEAARLVLKTLEKP